MNALGVAIVWLTLQVTILCVVALAVNFLIRRRDRPTTSPTAFALLLVVVLTALFLSPWPSWTWETETTGSESRVITGSTGSALIPIDEQSADHSLIPSEVSPDSPHYAAVVGFIDGLKGDLVVAESAAEESWRWTGWTAVFVLALMTIGLARLTIGWWSVRRCLNRSTLIDDSTLRDLQQQLQAEMCYGHRIRVYESNELASAATVGWWHPIIVLPTAWRGWTQDERRMVLAHELAHIVSGDSLTWMVAQVGLLLHFYHPLVHWLVRRLRLEQELSADANAALVSGGSQSYLLTLAELAVRQPECSVAWPARAFLPTRGTLLRRIEMLRDTPGGPDRPSVWRRSALIALTLATGLFASGIRRPTAPQVVAAEPAPVSPAAAAQDDSLRFGHVPKDAVFLIAFRPSQLAATQEFLPIAKLIEQSLEPEKTGIRLVDIQQFMMSASPLNDGARPNADPRPGHPVVTMRMSKPTDFAAFIKHNMGETTKQTVNGVSLISHSDISLNDRVEAAYLLDEQTLVQGHAHDLVKLAKASKESAPEWLSQLNEFDKAQFAFGFDVSFVRPMVERDFRRNPNPFLGMAAPLWQNADTLVGAAELEDEMTVTLQGFAASEGAAVRLQQTVSLLLPVAQGLLQGATSSVENAPSEVQEAGVKGIRIAQQALASAKVTQEGKVATLSMTGDGLGIAAVTGLMLPAVQAAREAARRTQSKNNLKQIALAFHNYHSVHNTFPPAVLLGPDGKTKYSWRVAILPFLEQQELYEQYDRTEPWDSPENKKVLEQIPPTYRHPSDGAASTNASYLAIVGEGTVFGGEPGEGTSLRDITDGSANTLLVVETRSEIPWTKPEDAAYASDDPLPKFGGYHEGGYNASLCDGSVRFISENIDEAVLRLLITCADGQPVNP